MSTLNADAASTAGAIHGRPAPARVLFPGGIGARRNQCHAFAGALGTVALLAGVWLLIARVDTTTGTCCMPRECNAVPSVGFVPTAIDGLCYFTPAEAEKFGCPNITGPRLQTCSPSNRDICTKDTNAILGTALGALGIVSGVFLLLTGLAPAVTSLKPCASSRRSATYMVAMLSGALGAATGVAGIVVAIMFAIRVFSGPFTAHTARDCKTYVGDTCVAFKTVHFEGCASVTSAGPDAYSLAWALDRSGMRAPTVLLLLPFVSVVVVGIASVVAVFKDCVGSVYGDGPDYTATDEKSRRLVRI